MRGLAWNVCSQHASFEVGLKWEGRCLRERGLQRETYFAGGCGGLVPMISPALFVVLVVLLGERVHGVEGGGWRNVRLWFGGGEWSGVLLLWTKCDSAWFAGEDLGG